MKIQIKSRGDATFLAIITAIGILLTFLFTVVSTSYYALVSVGAKPLVKEGLIFGAIPDAKPMWEVMGRNQLSVLIIGSDAHLEYDPGRSDTLIWALLDFRKEKVDIVSIPRDLLVRIPKRNVEYFDKICHAYSYGGTDLVKRATERFIGVTIDQVVRVDYKGFERIIDTLGGVVIDVEKDMDYDDFAGDLHIHIRKGRQVLDGGHALEYVRYRHDVMGDLARIKRQQKFLAALKKKSMSINQLGKIDDLARIVAASVYITPGNDKDVPLTARDILGLIIFFTKLDDGCINYHSVPIEADVIYNKLSSLVPDYKGFDGLMREIFNMEKTGSAWDETESMKTSMSAKNE